MREKLRHPLFVILFTVFVDLLGFGILIPVIPLLLADPASSYYLLPSNLSVNQGFILLGFLTAVFPIGQFFATPILGQLSDKFGRKNILAISLAGTCISYIIFAIGIYTRNIPLLFISRFFDGLTGGNIAVAQAAIADITTPQNRAKNFGLMGAAFGIGFIVGPFLGGKLSDPHFVSWFNATTPFIFAAILSLLNIISVLLFFPETLKNRAHNLKINWSRSILNIVHAYAMKKLRVLFVTNFLFWSGFGFFVTFFSVFLIRKFGFDQGNIGDFFAYIGIWIAFTQIVLTRIIGARLTDYKILRISLIGSAIMVLTYYFATSAWQFIFLVPVFAAFNGLSQANLPALVSKAADASVQGEMLGINASIQALSQAIPPVLSGYIAASLAPETPIVVGSGIMLIAALLFFFYYKPTTST
jgi:DHA1 family tetracycline resistance protein-like MFS transporter